MNHSASKVSCQTKDDPGIWHVDLAAPPTNILDQDMIPQLTEIFREAAITASLKAVVLSGQGEHFSYGVSIQEHRPQEVAAMLERFHGLFLAMNAAAVPLLAVVRGRCLGGGLELAAYCHRVFATPDAEMGLPEIKLGVFAPAGSLILPTRVGQRHTDDLCLSGRTVTGEQALAMGLVDQVSPHPKTAAEEWYREHLRPRSAAALRHAARASRLRFAHDFERQLAQVTKLYLNELMTTRDAQEGIEAFLEKRAPVWSDS